MCVFNVTRLVSRPQSSLNSIQVFIRLPHSVEKIPTYSIVHIERQFRLASFRNNNFEQTILFILAVEIFLKLYSFSAQNFFHTWNDCARLKIRFDSILVA